MTVVKVLTLFVVLAVSRPTIQTPPLLIGAQSAASLWKANVHRPFWEAITTFLVENVINRPGFATSNGVEEKLERLVNEINAGVYNFRIGEENEVWTVFTDFLCNFEVPTLKPKLAEALAQAGPSASKVNEAFAKSINVLSEEARNFIADLCTFLTKIKTYYMDQLYQYNGKPFLYNVLTLSKGRDKLLPFSKLLSPLKLNNKKPEVALHDHNKPLDDKYYAYDCMSSSFGTLIIQKKGNFLMVKVFGNKDVESCWDHELNKFHELLQNFLKKTFDFLKDFCKEKEWIFRIEKKPAILKTIQGEMDRGLTDFLKPENCFEVSLLVKRFMQSFEEPVITGTIAERMRITPRDRTLTPSEDKNFSKEFKAVVADLNKLPLPNKLLINEFLNLIHVIYSARKENKWTDAAGLAAMVDPCFTRVDLMSIDKTKKIADNKYPMLTLFIQNWGDKVRFEKGNFKQELV